ncbi:Sodium-dependent glucose transporter 1 [Lamellibrachia satsuma]|nr:Sodium-dependent glucose transporter 1 [Lamellibrachia satsuma]
MPISNMTACREDVLKFVNDSTARDAFGGLYPAKPTDNAFSRRYVCWLHSFGLGLSIAILGPTLLDLQQRTHTDIKQISRVFTVRSIGYLVGSIVGGFLFNFFNHSCLVGIFLLLTAIGTALAPWWQQLSKLMACISFVGMSMGLLDTGGNVVCLELWGRQSAPYMQALHFSFGIGAFVAPLVAAPFLSPLPVVFNTTLLPNISTFVLNITTTVMTPVGNGSDSADKKRSLIGVSYADYLRVIRAVEKPPDVNATIIAYHNQTPGTILTSQTFADQLGATALSVKKALSELTNVHYAYLVIALYLFIVSLMFFGTFGHECITGSASVSENKDNETTIHQGNCGFHVQLMVLMFIFYFLYVGAEVTYGGFVMKFAVSYMGWSKLKAAMLTSVFWGTFAFGRGIAIFLTRCLSPTVMLVADLVLSVASLCGLVLALQTSPAMLWFCTAVLGLSMASIFPTGITWAERYIKIGGKTAAMFVAGSALGEMTVPALVGFLFKVKGPMWLMYILLAGAVFTVFLFVVMQNLAANRGERYHSVPTSLPDDTLEMESLLVSDSDTSESPSSTRPSNDTSKKHVTFNVPNVRPSPVKRKVGIKND